MNTENLKKGQKIKNYKEMCKILNEKEKSGNSKQAQIKEWERYFSYKKQGYTFIVTDIYKQEKPKPPRADNVYLRLLETVLMNKLSLEEDFMVNFSKLKLYEYVGFTNINYTAEQKIINSFIGEVADKYSITQEQAKDYYKKFIAFSHKKFDRILFDALNSMQRRHLIYFTKIYTIAYYDENNNEIFREATNEEIEDILEITKEFHNMHPEYTYINTYNYNAYIASLNKEFMKRKGWESAYLTIKVIINKKYIRSDIPIVMEQLRKECEKNKLDVNYKVIERFNEHFDRVFNENKKKYEEQQQKKICIFSDDANLPERMGLVDLNEQQVMNDVEKEYVNLFVSLEQTKERMVQ
jgi:hypothetical protein